MEETLSSNQNRVKWTNLARGGERYHFPDCAGAAVASSVLQDVEVIENNSFVIDQSKFRRERQRCRKEIQQKVENFKLIDVLHVDG